MKKNTLICRANQWSGIYMVEISFMKKLNTALWLSIILEKFSKVNIEPPRKVGIEVVIRNENVNELISSALSFFIIRGNLGQLILIDRGKQEVVLRVFN